MELADKFCLRWNQHLENIGGALQECRAAWEFSDVTLACDDEEIKGHKVILSASSPVLRGLLQRYPHPQPLVYLRGVRGKHLAAIVDFIYRGEVDMEHSELATFLDLARDLQIKGLVRDNQKKQEPEQDAVRKGTEREKQEASDKEAGKICSDPIVDKAGERTVDQNIVNDQGSDNAKVVVKEECDDDLLTETATNLEVKHELVQEEIIESQSAMEGGQKNENLTKGEVIEAKVLEDLVESCNAKAKVLDELVEPREAGDELPAGWRRGAHRRLTGKHEYFIVTDLGLKFRSQVQVDNFLRYHNMKVQVRLKPSVEIIGELLKKSDECKAKDPEKKEEGNKVEIENKHKLEPKYFYNVQEGDDVDAIIISMMKINDDHLICTVCGLSKPSQVKMKNHIEQHIGGTSYTCNLCQKVFRTRYILGSHSRRDHGIPWDFKNSQRKNLPATKNENLKTVKTYSRADSQSVQKYFYTIQPGDDIDSIVALMIEKKDNTFSCKVCDVIKYVPSHMEDHVETHIGGTAYICSVCKKQRRTRVSLKLHMYKAHGEDPFKRM